MGMYDFDTLHLRAGTGSAKWDEAAAEGCPPGVVPFTVADMEFATAPIIVQAVRERAETGQWGYTHDDGSLKAAVAGWMKRRHGWQADPAWMVHTGGVVHALHVAVRVLTQAGDGVLIQTPVYQHFYSAVQQTGRVVVENPLRIDENGQYTIDFDDLEQKLPQANMMIFCNPHNPVGRVWSQQDVETVARLCFEYDVPLFSDEIHCDFVYPPHRHFSAGLLAGEDQLYNCLIGTSASKTFSLAGLSCSTLSVPSFDMRQRIEQRLERDGYNFNNVFGQIATKVAYHAAADWLDALLPYLQENHRQLKNVLEKNIPGVKVHDLQGTYLAWLDMRSLEMTETELQKFLRKEADFYASGGLMFGQQAEGYIRVNLACPRQVLLQALERLVAAYARRKRT